MLRLFLATKNPQKKTIFFIFLSKSFKKRSFSRLKQVFSLKRWEFLLFTVTFSVLSFLTFKLLLSTFYFYFAESRRDTRMASTVFFYCEQSKETRLPFTSTVKSKSKSKSRVVKVEMGNFWEALSVGAPPPPAPAATG